MPTMSPTTPMTMIPTTSGRTPGSIPGRVDVPIVVYARFEQPEGHEDAHEKADQQRDQERSPDPPRATPTAAREQATAIAMNSSTPWSTPQPIEPRIHSPRNSEVPITSRKTAKMTTRDRDADVGRDLLDLARDRSGLGLGKIDVCLGEPERGVACRADRRTRPRGRRAGAVPRCRTAASVAGSVRIVQGGAPVGYERGAVAMIAACRLRPTSGALVGLAGPLRCGHADAPAARSAPPRSSASGPS